MARMNAKGTKGRRNSGKIKKGARGKMIGNKNARKKNPKWPRKNKKSSKGRGRPKGSKTKKRR
jgi:hypothetical protein